MPKLRPVPAIAVKIRQPIRILEAHIRKINIQNHRADKLHFIQRFPSFMAKLGALGHRGSTVTARYAHVPDRTLIAAADHVAGYIASALNGEKVVISFPGSVTALGSNV